MLSGSASVEPLRPTVSSTSPDSDVAGEYVQLDRIAAGWSIVRRMGCR